MTSYFTVTHVFKTCREDPVLYVKTLCCIIDPIPYGKRNKILWYKIPRTWCLISGQRQFCVSFP